MIILRSAGLNDQPLLERWDQEADVAASGGDDDGYDWAFELPRIVDWRDMLIAEIVDQEQGTCEPIGMLVLIDAAREETHYWGEIDPHSWAMDIWIGEAKHRGQGYGRQMMAAALARCFIQHRAHVVLVDPLFRNHAARRFYQSCGFREYERRTFGQDDCMVYAITRAEFEQRR